jgi:endo-1,4-beta-mannosidase
VLPVAREAGAIGALIWCFSDYDPSMYSELPFDTLVHERYFGIFDAGGRLKATGEALREFAKAIR